MPWNWTSSWSSGLSPRGPYRDDPHPAASQLLDQKRLVGELAGQPVRRVDQRDVERRPWAARSRSASSPGRTSVAGVALVGEDPLLRDVKRALSGVLAQRGELEPIVSSFALRALETLA